jgi:hypothetical protein
MHIARLLPDITVSDLWLPTSIRSDKTETTTKVRSLESTVLSTDPD